MAKDYEIDRQGLRALATSYQMQQMVTAIANAGKAGAEAIAPRSNIDHQHYADSFVVENVQIKAGFDGMPRAGARLKNTAPHAPVVEDRHHVLATVKAIIESGGF